MPNLDLRALRRRGSQLFAGFTSGQKTMLALAAVATVLGGLFVMRAGSSAQMAPLFSNLPADSAAEVTAALDASGVPYELSEGGSTILVPREQIYRARLDLSAGGLPRDGEPGYSLLDEQGITTSEFRQRVDYQRAMEGELARTIEAIDGVDDAIVHLVMPERDLFSGDSQHPSASVLVATAPDRPLGAGQVQAVVHLVASSVEGLEAENVTVADNAGRVLSASGPEGAVAAAGDARASQTAAFESAMAARIQELLLPVTGAEGARVSVTAQLDFDRRSTTNETFGDPGTAPIVSETVRNETFEGTNGNVVGGILGPDGLPVEPGADGANSYERSDEDRVFANDKMTEVVEQAPGDIERLSVAVLLDEARGIDGQAVAQLVETSAGVDAARGDTVEVTQLPFDTSAAEQARAELAEARAAEERGQLVSLLRTVASVLIVAVVLFLAWRSHKKAAVARYPVAIPLPAADPDERGLPAADRDGADVDEDFAAITAGLDELPRPAATALDGADELQGQITDLIERQPDDVAQVLRAWMAER